MPNLVPAGAKLKKKYCTQMEPVIISDICIVLVYVRHRLSYLYTLFLTLHNNPVE